MQEQHAGSVRKRGWLAACMLALGLALTVLSFAGLFLAWAWSALVWAITLIILAAVLRKPVWLSISLVNLGAICFAFSLAEFWFAPSITAPADVYTGEYNGDYFIDHEILGYGPQPAMVATSKRMIDGDLIYDTAYTIDAQGRRTTPRPSSASGAVLIFGGSFTFGEGVQDEESMPYRLGVNTGSELTVYNYGFHGYGPHQMLAALERGMVESGVNEPVTDVIYQTIPDHVYRAVGRAFWDRSGPRYVMDEEGGVHYAGRFDDGKGLLEKALDQLLQKSQVYQRLFGLQKRISAQDIDLYVGIIDRARQVLLQQYPGVNFSVVLWGYPGTEVFDEIYAALVDRGIRVYRVVDILPEYADEPWQYELHPQDDHPNSLAHGLIADYIAQEIID